jgi:hypothetical protein
VGVEMSNDNIRKNTVRPPKITSVRKLTRILNDAMRNGEKELVKETVLENTETAKKAILYLNMKYRHYVRRVLDGSG